jgi:hypothetical protein
MQREASRIRSLLLGVAIALFAGFVPQPSTQAEVGADNSFPVGCEAMAPAASDSMLTEVGIDLSDDFGFALEESVELFRVDIRCRIRAMDDVAIQAHVLSKIMPGQHAETSPPLLV